VVGVRKPTLAVNSRRTARLRKRKGPGGRTKAFGGGVGAGLGAIGDTKRSFLEKKKPSLKSKGAPVCWGTRLLAGGKGVLFKEKSFSESRRPKAGRIRWGGVMDPLRQKARVGDLPSGNVAWGNY